MNERFEKTEEKIQSYINKSVTDLKSSFQEEIGKILKAVFHFIILIYNQNLKIYFFLKQIENK